MKITKLTPENRIRASFQNMREAEQDVLMAVKLPMGTKEEADAAREFKQEAREALRRLKLIHTAIAQSDGRGYMGVGL